jgi:hypothetical protein
MKGRWNYLHGEKPQNLYSSKNVTRCKLDNSTKIDLK